MNDMPQERDIDPSLVLPSGYDIRAMGRAERRRHGFRGPLWVTRAPSLNRFVRRHAEAMSSRPKTRRQRKERARIRRAISARGGA